MGQKNEIDAEIIRRIAGSADFGFLAWHRLSSWMVKSLMLYAEALRMGRLNELLVPHSLRDKVLTFGYFEV